MLTAPNFQSPFQNPLSLLVDHSTAYSAKSQTNWGPVAAYHQLPKWLYCRESTYEVSL